jgi:asparagine synthase (glutamine-hydrolysing)
MVWYLEDPAGREETAFLYVTSREAARYVDMLMAGYAADAFFGGMPRHLIAKAALQLPLARRPLQEFFAHSQAGLTPKTMLGRALVKLYHRDRSYPPPRIIGAAQLPEVDGLKPTGDQPFSEFLRRVLLRGAAGQKVERLHACFGLAFNSPFMDNKVSDCAFEIPDRLKIRGRTQKYILRKAFEDILPSHILSRRKTLQKLKHDLAFSEVLDHLAEEFLPPGSVSSRGLFEAGYVERLLQRPAGSAYATERAYRIWTMVLTEVWCQLFLDRRGQRPRM